MAGTWLKYDTDTADKPEVWSIAQVLEIDPDAVVGKLLRVWTWFDAQTENGNAPSVTKSLLDRKVGVTGFCDAMVTAGWMLDDGETISLPNFDRHNGKTAKNRALTAKRVADHKRKGNGKGNDEVTPDALPREEKRRSKSTPSGVDKARKPKPLSVDDLVAEGVDRELAAEWLAIRKRHRAPLTPRAWETIKAEAQTLGWTPAQAVEKANARGWRGFEAAWVQREQHSKGTTNKQEALEQRNANVAEEWASGGVQ